MRKKMKLAAVIIASLVAGILPLQGVKTAEAAPSDLTNAGGWTITEQEAAALPEEVASGFSDAAYGTDLTPVALVAQQVVKGTNDMLLCRNDDEYRMIVVNRDLENNATLKSNVKFNLSDYTAGGEEGITESLDGGWYTPDDITSVPLPEDAQAAFEKALENFAGSNIVPMALLGTQVVKGINYAILCHVTPMVYDPVSSTQVITIYSDPEGNAEISNLSVINPADYSGGSVLVYRFYNPNSGEHFYTAVEKERDDLIAAGWNYEFDGCFWAPAKSSDDALPVYRLYNPNGNDHHYTIDEAEALAVKEAGWIDEGISFYAYRSDLDNGAPVYRVYNPNDGYHFFTTDLLEARSCIKAGWNDEGIAWNVVE